MRHTIKLTVSRNEEAVLEDAVVSKTVLPSMADMALVVNAAQALGVELNRRNGRLLLERRGNSHKRPIINL